MLWRRRVRTLHVFGGGGLRGCCRLIRVYFVSLVLSRTSVSLKHTVEPAKTAKPGTSFLPVLPMSFPFGVLEPAGATATSPRVRGTQAAFHTFAAFWQHTLQEAAAALSGRHAPPEEPRGPEEHNFSNDVSSLIILGFDWHML